MKYNCDSDIVTKIIECVELEKSIKQRDFNAEIATIDKLLPFIEQALVLNTPCVDIEFVGIFENTDLDLYSIELRRLFGIAVYLHNYSSKNVDVLSECYHIIHDPRVRSYFMYKLNVITKRLLDCEYVWYHADYDMRLEPIVPICEIIKVHMSKSSNILVVLIATIFVIPIILMMIMFVQFLITHRVSYKMNLLKNQTLD